MHSQVISFLFLVEWRLIYVDLNKARDRGKESSPISLKNAQRVMVLLNLWLLHFNASIE